MEATLDEKEIVTMMRLSDQGLKDFVFEEREIYSVKDLKVRYN